MAEIIAELCQNHNGDIKLVEEMVYAAAESGATYAKIQSMLSAEIPKRDRFEEGLVENGVTKVIKRPYQAEYDRLSKLDLNDEQHYMFLEFCKKAGIKPMTTVFTRSRIPFVSKLGLDTVKLASFDCSSFPMIRELRKSGDFRIILSTGVTFDREIEEAARILSGTNFALLHCISIYPTPLNEAHLNRMKYLRKLCKHVGLSDHSNPEKDGLKMSLSGLAMGAEIIERHFTILPKDKTRDGPVSLNPAQLKELCSMAKLPNSQIQTIVSKEVPEYASMMGREDREMSATELLNRDYYRGRFASKKSNGEWVYNWEDKALT